MYRMTFDPTHKPRHYRELEELVEGSVFQGKPYEPYLRNLFRDAKIFTPPIQSTDIQRMFEGSSPESHNYVNRFVQRALDANAVVPLNGLNCVVDDFSAVFLENYHEPRTVVTTVYREDKDKTTGIDGVFYFGLLRLERLVGRKYSFKALNIVAGIVKKGRFREFDNVADGVALASAGKDLVQAVIISIEQLAYMHRMGLLRINT